MHTGCELSNFVDIIVATIPLRWSGGIRNIIIEGALDQCAWLWLGNVRGRIEDGQSHEGGLLGLAYAWNDCLIEGGFNYAWNDWDCISNKRYRLSSDCSSISHERQYAF